MRDLDMLGSQYLAILINEEQPIADLSENFSETYNLDLNVRLQNLNPIIQLFQPDISISKNTILEGAFYQTPENTVFNFFTSIDTLPGFCDEIPNDCRKLNMLDALRIHSIQNCANGWQRFEEVSRGHIPPPGDVAT